MLLLYCNSYYCIVIAHLQCHLYLCNTKMILGQVRHHIQVSVCSPSTLGHKFFEDGKSFSVTLHLLHYKVISVHHSH